MANADEFREAHTAPVFNVLDEPWIAVRYTDGRFEDVSVRTLFTDAHLISDLAEEYPLVRAAMRRYLTALTVRLIQLTGEIDSDDWADRILDRSGFTADEVNLLMVDQEPFSWLWHPVSPFMQDMNLLDADGDSRFARAEEMVPHLPAGDSEAAWFDLPGSLALTKGVSPTDAARFLLTRWFYVFAGNSGGGIMGTPFVSVSADAPLTQVYLVDSEQSLFATMLRNITTPLIEGGSQGGPDAPAWMDRDGYRPKPLGSPLYEYTLTTSSTLLGPCDATGGVVRDIMRRTLDKKERKALFEQARDAAKEKDPHIYWVVRQNGDRTGVRLNPADTKVRMLQVLRRYPTPAGGVADRGTAWIKDPSSTLRHELLLGTATGAALSMKWSEIATVTVPAAYFDTTDPQALHVAALLDGVITPIEQSVYATCVKAFTRDGRKEDIGKAVAVRARTAWQKTAEQVVTRVLADTVNGLPVDQDSARAELWNAARREVYTVLAPYEGSAAWASSITQAKQTMYLSTGKVSPA